MGSVRFFWKLFLGNALLFAIVFGASIWFIVAAVESTYRTDLTRRLHAQAVTIRTVLEDRFEPSQAAMMQAMADRLGGIEDAHIRVTIINADGVVWADSDADAQQMTLHADRPEVIDAMAHGWGQSDRWSNTVDREMQYVAVRVGPADAPLGTVRVAMPDLGITTRTDTTRRLIWSIAVAGIGAALLLALGLARFWSNPIRRITETARSLSEGDLSARVEVAGNDEIAQMATSLNQMRDSLAMQLSTIERQKHNLEYLIHALTEGVIVAGPDGRIVLMNPAASRLVESTWQSTDGSGVGDRCDKPNESNVDAYVGQNVRDCISHPVLRDMLLVGESPQDAIGGVLSLKATDDSGLDLPISGGNGEQVRELRLDVERPGGVVHLMARGADIEAPGDATHPDDTSRGRLVVLSDITELTRTIRMKTDFVANASHELRTPLAAIRASAETLLHMNVTDAGGRAGHFLRVIDRHANRLEALIGDLLDLARLESQAARFPPEEINLPEFLAELHGRFAHAIEDKRLLWNVTGDVSCVRMKVNALLLRLVLDNLVANAIKFTDAGGSIHVSSARGDGGIEISVADTGCGIAPEEQGRVFERFYQVERARSVAGSAAGQRGTGLGLSIVRHAVAAMRGAVQLTSAPGRGTTVTVALPAGDA